MKIPVPFPFFLKVFFITEFIFIIMLLGAFCNFQAIASNNGKMPVYTNLPYLLNYSDNTHFYYNSKSAINNSFYSDRFNIHKNVYSIGDFLIFSGIFLWFLFSIYIFYKYKKWKKQYIIQQHKGF